MQMQEVNAKLLMVLVVLLGICSLAVVAAGNAPTEEKDVAPPPTDDKAKTARYIAHKANRCTMTTISSNESLKGMAFSQPTSVSDGTVSNSTGIPYMYHAKQAYVVKDILLNNQVTLSYSEAMFGYEACAISKDTDPEWPICARLTMMGKMVILSDPAEIATAKVALFSRHPAMASWSSAHSFDFLKLKITNVLLIDYFGGWVSIPLKDYFNVKL